jgi:hypothetical protein
VGVSSETSAGVGVGEALLRFDFPFGVALGDGVGEIFFRFGEAAGEGVGVAFFVELFRCFTFGIGVGEAKIFLIFVPKRSSAASDLTIAPNNTATIRKRRSPALDTVQVVERFRETPVVSASDTEALQFGLLRLTFREVVLIVKNNQPASS